jgi:hypothetical protein
MTWQCVVVRDSDVAGDEASALIHAFASNYRRAGVPAGAKVYKGQSEAGDRLFYFSPEASALAKETLRKFEAAPCVALPNLSVLKQILI